MSNAFDTADWNADRQVEATVGNTRALLWIATSRIDDEWTHTEVGGEASFT